jgi:hypothetical protein
LNDRNNADLLILIPTPGTNISVTKKIFETRQSHFLKVS